MNRRNFLLGLVVTPVVASLPAVRPEAPLPLSRTPTPGEFYEVQPGDGWRELKVPRYIEITRAGIYHLSTAFAGLAVSGLYELQADGVTVAAQQIVQTPGFPFRKFQLEAFAELRPGQRVHWPTVPEGSELEAHIRVARIGERGPCP